MITSFAQKVYSAVRQIPSGKVTSYGEVARRVGNPRAVRAVGNALKHNRRGDIPCHRVVRSDGLAGGYNRGTVQKVLRLKREGVHFRGGRVLPAHWWKRSSR